MLTPGTRLGPCEIQTPIGAVAIKILPDALATDPRFRERSDDGTGRLELYLARFPEGTGRVQVTRSGGGSAFWSRTGDELFFQGLDHRSLTRRNALSRHQRTENRSASRDRGSRALAR